VLQSFYLSLRMEGIGPTVCRYWARLFGRAQWYVFVRFLQPPSTRIELPVEDKGIVVRTMQEGDLADLRVRWHEPRKFRGRCDTIVATRQGRIVGAVWYADAVTTEQPWYGTVQPHLIPPARFTANIFIIPGDKGAAWTIAKTGSEWLATKGVRTIVGMIGAGNKPSILMTRLLGGKMVGRVSVCYCFGWPTTRVEPVSKDEDATITKHSEGSPHVV
jgi:hypothetical protein